MILKCVRVLEKGNQLKKDIFIEEDKIISIKDTSNEKSHEDINFKDDVIAFSGLINSHDHLALNTHKIHKSRVYKDYIDWASDNFEKTIKEINSIPFHLRYKWGIIKNVLCGFTTVLQHDKGLPNYESDLIDVELNFKIIHSLFFEPKWKIKTLMPSREMKIIHLGEGTSSRVSLEAKKFLLWSLQAKKSIIVHGIAVKPKEIKKMAGIIWCPNSNIHLYNTTASIDVLKSGTSVLFGTDSTISSDWNIFHHLRQARNMEFLSDEALFDTISRNPCELFNWTHKKGLNHGKNADIVIAKKKKSNIWDAFYELQPSDILLIIKSGNIIFFDKALLPEIDKHLQIIEFEPITLLGSHKYIKFPIKSLVNDIKNYYPKFELPKELKID